MPFPHYVVAVELGAGDVLGFYIGPHWDGHGDRLFADSPDDPRVLVYDGPTHDADVLAAEGWNVRRLRCDGLGLL